MRIGMPGFTDYACNTQGMMNGYQLYQRDSIENAQSFVEQFKVAIENGLNPNDSYVQEQIFNSGSLRYEDLTPEAQEYVIKEVEKAYKLKNY